MYERHIDHKNPKNTTKAMLITQMTSAFWHGFYPIYYLTFLNMHFLIDAARACYKAGLGKHLPSGTLGTLVVNQGG